MNFPFRNMRDVPGLHARVSPHKPALISYDSQFNRYEMSYLELVGKSHQVANFLYEDLGINRGDTVALLNSNHENVFILYCATMVIGAAVLSLNPAEDLASLEQAVDNSNARFLFAEHILIDKARHLVNNTASLEGIIQIGGEQRDDTLRFEDLASNRPTTFLGDESGAKGADIPVTGGNERTARLTDIAVISYENRNTIYRTQGDLLRNASLYSSATALTGNQKVIVALPLPGNFAETLIAPLMAGATIIMLEQVSADQFWHVLVKENGHIATLDARIIGMLTDSAQNHIQKGEMRFGGKIIQQDIKHFRYIFTTDTNLTPELARDFEELFGIPLITGFTHPETGDLLTLLPVIISWEQHQKHLHGRDSVSIGTPLIDIAITDKNGQLLETEQVGFIANRNKNGNYIPTVQQAYYLNDDGRNLYYLCE